MFISCPLRGLPSHRQTWSGKTRCISPAAGKAGTMVVITECCNNNMQDVTRCGEVKLLARRYGGLVGAALMPQSYHCMQSSSGRLVTCPFARCLHTHRAHINQPLPQVQPSISIRLVAAGNRVLRCSLDRRLTAGMPGSRSRPLYVLKACRILLFNRNSPSLRPPAFASG